MSSQEISNQQVGRERHCTQLLKGGAIGLLLFVATAAIAVQENPALQAVTPKHTHPFVKTQDQDSSAPKKLDLGENGPLITELARVAVKIQQGVELPPPRTQSKLLKFLPTTTAVYFSAPNFGETLYQANQIFNHEVHESTVLSEWWQNKAGLVGMMAGAVIEQIHQFTGYLGDEIVVSGTVKPGGGSFVVLAEVKKPGLKAFLQQLVTQYGGENPPVKILTPQQLLTATASADSHQVLALVRPDFLVVSSDLSALRSLNTRLNSAAGTFASTPFGQRLGQAYQGGVSVLLGADLQKLLALRPQGQPQIDAVLQQTGFANVQYAIMDGKIGGGASASNSELSFNGPRQGIAAWLAPPTNLGGLDFVSPNPIYAGAIALEGPAQIFDDIKSIVDSVNPMASAGLTQMQSELGIDPRADLLAKLAGQFAFAVESSSGSEPAWKVMAQVNDPEGLQKTFKQLLEAANEKALPGKGLTLRQEKEEGLDYSSLSFYSGQKRQEVDYAFADGYLVVASAPAVLREALATHRGGTSLAKSVEFHKLLSPEHGGQASAVVLQNTALSASAMAKTLPPEIAQLMQSLGGQNHISFMSAYGEERAIRTTSNSQQFNVAVPLLVAAVAIPNLMRSRTAANEAAAAATVRTLNVAQVTYQTMYGKGFASDLATLGPGPDGSCSSSGGSASHACIIDSKLGCESGACTKNDFQYSVTASCNKQVCQDYVALATPLSSSAGNKSFCSTSDGVVRSKSGPAPTEPISAAECQTWNPM
jgi:type IV pilus assembly protein PilA